MYRDWLIIHRRLRSRRLAQLFRRERKPACKPPPKVRAKTAADKGIIRRSSLDLAGLRALQKPRRLHCVTEILHRRRAPTKRQYELNPGTSAASETPDRKSTRLN